MSFSSHHHFVLCLFLLSFLCVNSQSSPHAFVVILKNETPSVVFKYCIVYGKYSAEFDHYLKPGGTDNITTSIVSGENNTLECPLELKEKRGVFKLFDLNDTSICHVPSEECVWKIQEDGLCMLSQGKCVMFGWDKTLSIRHTASELIRYNRIAREPMKYIASDELKSEHNI
ncbi:hypothetical protein R3W88_025423 [Solanum pinnatisectum]|uniref:Uncharacterized protein n=1 Tax=Solanum pinnatisectum TaxID=50273 RepID=A0AAV9M658_9SOLN|nr:hypothetical protein R3W88_025423 [Solanum pinnatisectum]